MLITAILVLLVVLATWRLVPAILEYRRKCLLVKSIPGWPTHWLLGNLLQLFPTEKIFYKWIDYIEAERHKVTCTWLGPSVIVIGMHHPDAVKQVLKAPKSDFIYSALLPWLGEGLLVAKGEKWARNRRLLTPAFHFAILKPYVSVYNSCLEMFFQKWTDSARNNQSVLVFDTVSLLSLDIILKCAFSYSSKCQGVENKHLYIAAVYKLCDLITTRFLNPLNFYDWIYNLTPSGRRVKHLCNLVHRHAEEVIYKRRKALRLDNTEASIERKEVFAAVAKQERYLDFLDILLSSEDEEGNGLTDIEIRSEVDTFMFEGHDTTTSGTSWTLYCLAKYPEHQEKVREEVRRVLDGREWLEYDDLKKLQYTQWCIKEAMRLYPPVDKIVREANQDLEVCGYTIPKGVQILIAIFSLHRHPDVWENPHDFDPLRFHPNAVDKRDPYAYMPFSAGPRNCIGQNFAMNEMRVVVASIVHRFNFSLENKDPPELVPYIVLRPKEDIRLKIDQLQSYDSTHLYS